VPSKKQRIHEWLAAQAPGAVDEAVLARLRAALPDISGRTVREALRESGLPLTPLVEGVRQDTFEHLSRTLVALAGEYGRGSPERRHAIRDLVITAKSHAQFAAANPKVSAEARAQKEEMLLWLRTWLENPPVFPLWCELRRGLAAAASELAE
jgi:hypothetical protein